MKIVIFSVFILKKYLLSDNAYEIKLYLNKFKFDYRVAQTILGAIIVGDRFVEQVLIPKKVSSSS